MKLSRALKEKNRLKAEIGKLQSRIGENNVWVDSHPAKYDASKEAARLNETINELIELKTKIFVATNPIRKKIEQSAQLKAHITFLRGLDCDDSETLDREYTPQGVVNVKVKKHATLDRVTLDSTIDACEKTIQRLQDEVDEFNAVTDI